MRDPYSVLGVKKDAGADEIKAAWRTIAKAVHPDQNRDDPSATRRFAEIGEAYDLLRDPQKRTRYDQARLRAEQKLNEQTIMQQRNMAREAAERARVAREKAEKVMEELARTNARKPSPGAAGAARNGGTGEGSAEDAIFERIFGEKPAAAQKADASAGTDKGAEGSTTGGESAEDATAAARGTFLKFAAADLIASFVRRIRGAPPAAPEKLPDITMDADVTVENLLRRDRITVTLADGREVRFNIEPGMTDGHVVHLAGQGLKVQGLPRGDLLLTISVPRDGAFGVRGFDIHTSVSVPLEDAVLGCEVEIQTPQGPMPLTIPPWSGSDRNIRIEGKGLANRDGGHGDLVAEIRIVLHEKPDEKVTDLMRHKREGLYL